MIIVTGASGGLGRALVQELAGADVVVGTYFRHPPESTGRWYPLDVTQPDSIDAFVQAIGPEASKITLVNLAGRSIDRLAINMTVEEWREVLDVNLTGAFLMSRALLKVMMKEKWGRIINVSSVVAQSGAPGTAAYAAAKAGLLGLTATLAKEYARFNITVNCLTLGYFSEGLIHTIPDSAKQALLGRIPLRRLGAHADVAGAVRYLMGAAYTTGARLDVTGGFS